MTIRDVRLPQGAGLVDIATYPIETECYWLCLSNQEIHILRAFTFPFARYETRFVQLVAADHKSIQGNLYRTQDDAAFSDYQGVIDQIDLKLGGCNLSCTELAEKLDAITAAITAAGAESGCTINVEGAAGLATLSGALAGIPEAEYLPTPAETPPEEGVPPEGFETWAAYRAYKCRAAHATWRSIWGMATGLSTITGASAAVALAVPLVGSFLAVFMIAIPPAAFVELIMALIAVAAIEAGAMYAFSQVADYLLANKTAIICELYDSGDAATALEAINNRIEDAIQAIEWGEILGPFGGQLAPLFGSIMGAVQDNSLVNPLFKVSLAIIELGITCPCSELPENRYWQFTADGEGWLWQLTVPAGGLEWFHTWENPGYFGAEGNGDPGQLQDHCTGAGAISEAQYSYDFPQGYHPVAGPLTHVFMRVQATAGTVVWTKIIYDDDAVDAEGYEEAIGWSTIDNWVSLGNVGKAIKSILVAHNHGQHSEDLWFAFDDVRLLSE